MHQWVSYQGRVPYPRPGVCPSKTFGTFSSTKDFPDDVIQFARNHPLMYNPVLPMGGRPLFLQVGAGYTFTQIAADRVAAADGHYDVLFIGTGQGPAVTTHQTQSGLFSKFLLLSPLSRPLPGLWPYLLLDAVLIDLTHILHRPNHAEGGGLQNEKTPGPSCQGARGVTHPFSSLQMLAQC